MLKKLWLLGLVAALTLAACAAAATPLPPSGVSSETGAGAAGGFVGEPPQQPAATFAPAEAQRGALGDAANAVQPTAGDRLVVRNANLSLVVKDPAESLNTIATLAESLGGFVVSSNIYQTSLDAQGNKIMQANISIRVPADQLQSALAQLKEMAVSVNSESTSGEDVTAQYTDLESRLRNLEAAEAQLQRIMDSATKTEDVLTVYNQLIYIRDQIEQVKGQMQYYRESAALSLITVDLIPDALSRPIEVGGWRPEGVAKDALEALVRSLQGIATVVIWSTIYLLPLGLVCGLPVFLGARFAVRRLRRPRSAPPPAPASTPAEGESGTQ